MITISIRHIGFANFSRKTELNLTCLTELQCQNELSVEDTEVKMYILKPYWGGVFFGNKIDSKQKRTEENFRIHLSHSRLTLLPIYSTLVETPSLFETL